MKNTDKPNIITWEKYKTDNNITTIKPIMTYGLEEQGFVKLDNVLRLVTGKKKPKEMVQESVNGKDFTLVVYDAVSQGWNRAKNIFIYAK